MLIFSELPSKEDDTFKLYDLKSFNNLKIIIQFNPVTLRSVFSILFKSKVAFSALFVFYYVPNCKLTFSVRSECKKFQLCA